MWVLALVALRRRVRIDRGEIVRVFCESALLVFVRPTLVRRGLRPPLVGQVCHFYIYVKTTEAFGGF